MEVNNMALNKKKESDLENWELYSQYLKAIDALANYEGPKWENRVVHSVDTKGTHTAQMVTVPHPAYQDVLSDLERLTALAEKYRSYLVEMETARNANNFDWSRLISEVLKGAFAIVTVLLAIGGKHWLESRDSYDDGNVLTDLEKYTLKNQSL
jgi:hypothetical protein